MSAPAWRKPVLYFGAIIAAWTVIAVLTTWQFYATGVTGGQKPEWWPAFVNAIPWYGLWALLTPVMLWLARIIPFSRRELLRFFGLHLAAGLTVCLVHMSTYAAVAVVINRHVAEFPSYDVLLARKLSSSTQVELMSYVIITGLAVAARVYRDLHARELDAERLRVALGQTETALLRAQMQPHFLFNTLNAISALVAEDPAKARTLIALLGDLLRMSLEDGRAQETRLADEMALTRAYLAIEQARLGDRLTVVEEIAPDVLSLTVPSLLLQPLVENAVRHGIAPLVRGGTVWITARRVDGRLRIGVADDGRGAVKTTEGIGLGNTRRRLTQLYGDRACITVESGKGFQVTIDLPVSEVQT